MLSWRGAAGCRPRAAQQRIHPLCALLPSAARRAHLAEGGLELGGVLEPSEQRHHVIAVLQAPGAATNRAGSTVGDSAAQRMAMESPPWVHPAHHRLLCMPWCERHDTTEKSAATTWASPQRPPLKHHHNHYTQSLAHTQAPHAPGLGT